MATDEKLISEVLEDIHNKTVGSSDVNVELSNLDKNATNQEEIVYDTESLKRLFYMTLRKYAFLFPLKLAFLMPATCLITYTIAISLGHLHPIFPYVSDCGALAPEAGYFAMLFDIMAFLAIFTGYYRYRMIKYEIKNQVPASPFSRRKSPKAILHFDNMNFLSLLFICLYAFGLITVGNFRSSEQVFLHSIGAWFLFAPMPAYFYVQIHIACWLAEHEVESKPISMFVWNIIGIVGFVGFAIFSNISVAYVGMEKLYDNDFRFHWNSEQEGYLWHVLGTIFEWIAINTISPLSFCLFNRMRKFEHFDKV